MALTSNTNDQIPSQAASGFSTSYDWKNTYVSTLAEDGYERFAQYSASPDATMLFAGPARFTGLGGDASILTPIGLTDGIQMQSNPQLARLYEIGSNRAFFTRGKTQSALTLGKMLADQQNILSALSAQAFRPGLNDQGMGSAGATSPNPNIMMNLDSEYFNVPFGLLLLFKTRGGGDAGYGKVLTALYLEYCMFSSYNFNIASTSPVIMEGVGIEFDRPVPVAFN
jgi:hypothetical protein